jgi:hypothetical protein
MPQLNISVPHQLAQDEALKRIKKAIGELKKQHSDRVNDFQENWTGSTGTFKVAAAGFSGSGSIRVNPSDVTLESSLPAAAFLIKGKIESAVRDRLKTVLA